MTNRERLRQRFLAAKLPPATKIMIGDDECWVRRPTLDDRDRWLELAGVHIGKGDNSKIRGAKLQVLAGVVLLVDDTGTALLSVENIEQLTTSSIGGDFDAASKTAMEAFNPPAKGVDSLGNDSGETSAANGISSSPTNSAEPSPN